ncbi:MAG: FkbM family methyltransferase [Phycisphaerae bacterium]|nr:FkbM family methyltransferase [Phycisphaerae bacterium]
MTAPAPARPQPRLSQAHAAALAPLALTTRDLDALLLALDTPRGSRAQPVWVRLRPAGGLPLLVRPGTTDARVIVDTFVGLYHLPPGPLPERPTILDLGANAGYTAAHFAALYPDARIIALELDADTADAARRTLAPLGERVTVLNAAAWDRDGSVHYGGQEEWGFAASDPPGPCNPAADDAGRTAPAVSMPTLLDRFGLDRIDYAKIDIEGGEARLLTPDAAWLDSVRTLKVEVHPPAATMAACRAALTARGMAVTDDTRHWSCLIARRP